MYQNNLANSYNLEYWLNPVYVSLFKNGGMHELFFKEPFGYFYLENLFLPEVFEAILIDVQKTKRSAQFSGEEGKEYQEASGREYFLLGSEQLLRFFLGKQFQKFLFALTGHSLILHEKEFPQLRQYPRISSGLKIHNDVSSHFEFGTLFYLNKAWQKSWGGQTNLWELDRKDRTFRKFTSIEPQGNCLLGIQCSRNSWHNVDAMNALCERENLFFQFAIERGT